MGEGMVGSDRGEDAYRRENKMTTTLRSSSSSLVSLCCVLATSLTATRSYSYVASFVALEPWVRMVLSAVGAGYVVVGGRWSCNSRRDSLLLGCRRRSLGAGRRLPLPFFFACSFRLGSCHMSGGRLVCVGGCVTWQRVTWRAHALSLTLMTWACVLLSCFVVRRLSWFVGGQGRSWWWVLRVGDMVAGRCWVGGCGMKKEAVSLFVTM